MTPLSIMEYTQLQVRQNLHDKKWVEDHIETATHTQLQGRQSLHDEPKKEVTCFYGNPLGSLALIGGAKRHCENLPEGLWAALANPYDASRRDSTSKDAQKHLRYLYSTLSHQSIYYLAATWEWLWSLKNKNERARFNMFSKFGQSLMNGYSLVMESAMTHVLAQTTKSRVRNRNELYDRLDAAHILEGHFPELWIGTECRSIKPVTKAASAGTDYHDFYTANRNENPTLLIPNVPHHLSLLVLEKMREAKGLTALGAVRGTKFEQQIAQVERDCLPVNTPPGIRIEDLPAGGKRQVVEHGSPTSRLLVAIAIEKWLLNNSNAMAQVDVALRMNHEQ